MAVGLLASALLLPVTAAHAQGDAASPSTSAHSASDQRQLPDFGRITVHAWVNSSTTPKPVAGVSFELVRIEGVAVGSPRAADLIRHPDRVTEQMLGSKVVLGPTDVHGDVSVERVELGLYLLRELRTASSTAVGFHDLVFAMPSADPSNGSVLAFNLSIYPKIPAPEPTGSPTPTATSTATSTPTPTSSSTPQPTTTTPAPATPTSDPKGTQTGDRLLANDGLLVVVGGLALGGAVVLLLVGQRRRRGEHS